MRRTGRATSATRCRRCSRHSHPPPPTHTHTFLRSCVQAEQRPSQVKLRAAATRWKGDLSDPVQVLLKAFSSTLRSCVQAEQRPQQVKLRAAAARWKGDLSDAVQVLLKAWDERAPLTKATRDLYVLDLENFEAGPGNLKMRKKKARGSKAFTGTRPAKKASNAHQKSNVPIPQEENTTICDTTSRGLSRLRSRIL